MSKPLRVAVTGFVPATELVCTRRSKCSRGSASVPGPSCNFRSIRSDMFRSICAAVRKTLRHRNVRAGLQMSSYMSHTRPTFQPSVSTRPKAINAGGQKLASLLLIAATVLVAVGGASVGANVTPSSCACSTKAVISWSNLEVGAVIPFHLDSPHIAVHHLLCCIATVNINKCCKICICGFRSAQGGKDAQFDGTPSPTSEIVEQPHSLQLIQINCLGLNRRPATRGIPAMLMNNRI
jgi:hypothetical protein